MIADNRGGSQGVFEQLFANLLKFFLFFADAGATRRCDFLTAKLYKIARADVGFVAKISRVYFCFDSRASFDFAIIVSNIEMPTVI